MDLTSVILAVLLNPPSQCVITLVFAGGKEGDAALCCCTAEPGAAGPPSRCGRALVSDGRTSPRCL